MKQDTDKRNWMPTLTLAKLYEEQNQFYDALAAYELLSQTDASPAIRKKVEELQLRILSDPNLMYDERIQKLFSPEELAYFKIINHAGFEHLCKVQEQIRQSEANSDYDLISEEDNFDYLESQLDDDIDKMLKELFEEKKTVETSQEPISEEVTVCDFVKEIITRFGIDTPMQEVSIVDLLQLILEFRSK